MTLRDIFVDNYRVSKSMVTLVLETVKPALSRGVVPTVPFATHRTGHAKLFELILELMAGILAATI